MSRSKSAYLMPLRKKMAAVVVSSVMVFSLCPWGQALASDGANQGAAKTSAQVETSGASSDTSQSAEAAIAKAQSLQDSLGIDGNESSDDDNNIAKSGFFGFELHSLDSKGSELESKTIWANDDGVYDNKSFGDVDYGSTLKLKVVGPNGYLDEGAEFTVSGLDKASQVGTHTVTVKGEGTYSGSISLTYTVGGSLSSSKAQVSTQFKNSGYYAYTGSQIKPKLTVKMGSTTLREGTDYVLKYDNNTSGDSNGKATVWAEGIGAFEGKTKAQTFHIIGLTYNSYGQGKWKGSTKLGGTSGVSSGTSKVGKIAVKKTSDALSGDVSYSVYNDNKWRGAKNGDNAGIAGQAAQTMWFKLSGKMADHFDIYYRVCISGAGWMAWAKNGSNAGVKNFNSKMKITGYQIKLVEKNGGTRPANASLSTAYASSWDGFAKDILYSRIKDKTSKTAYTISVDTTFNRIAIYKGSKGKWKLAKYWKCGTGIKSRPTTKGDFSITTYRRARIDSGSISYWNFCGYGGSLGFHSVVTKTGKKNKLAKPLSKQLGVNVSHGCVRVTMDNSKWIWNNIRKGTSVCIRGLV